MLDGGRPSLAIKVPWVRLGGVVERTIVCDSWWFKKYRQDFKQKYPEFNFELIRNGWGPLRVVGPGQRLALLEADLQRSIRSDRLTGRRSHVLPGTEHATLTPGEVDRRHCGTPRPPPAQPGVPQQPRQIGPVERRLNGYGRMTGWVFGP